MQKQRKPWFRAFKRFMKLFKKETEFVYLGEKINAPAVILSNHVGTSAPLSFELYLQEPLRFWGAHEMNDGLVALYQYQTQVSYHEKKGWNIHLARLFCLIASPLTNIFYRGLNLISTYRDIRFRHTLRESYEAVSQGQNIVIFPEISDKGYLDHLEGFHEGFVSLLKYCYKQGLDLPVYATYYHKATHVHMIDTPVRYSELVKNGMTQAEIAQYFCDRCNRLGERCEIRAHEKEEKKKIKHTA